MIPELITNLPFSVFATSSIDAFVHAIEAYLSPKATPFTELYSNEAMRLIIDGYQKLIIQGDKAIPLLANQFVLASCYAGIAFGNAGVGCAHAMSYPLSGAYHVAHGEANYVFFSKVFQTYQELKPDGKITELNAFLSSLLGCNVNEVYVKLEQLFYNIIPKYSLSHYGVKEELSGFAENVLNKQNRLMVNSYVLFRYDQILGIFRSLM